MKTPQQLRQWVRERESSRAEAERDGRSRRLRLELLMQGDFREFAEKIMRCKTAAEIDCTLASAVSFHGLGMIEKQHIERLESLAVKYKGKLSAGNETCRTRVAPQQTGGLKSEHIMLASACIAVLGIASIIIGALA